MKQQNIKFLLILLISLMSVSVSAHNIEVKNADGVTIYYRYINNGTAVAVTYRGSSYNSYSNEYSGNVVIPECVTYNGTTYSVTSIWSEAFRNCSSLTSITIPNSVTSIGEYAFYSCTKLKSIDIPNNVTSISNGTFFGCTSLSSVTISNSLTSIGNDAFRYCRVLRSITLPNCVTSIGEYAFYECGLTSINIPIGVTAITKNTFYGCSDLRSITIPNSVKTIAEYAFSGCSVLASVTIPNSVTTIALSVFGGCRALTSIIVEDGNTKYDSRNNCNAIIETSSNRIIVGCKNTIIPNSVTSIAQGAFSGCSFLTSITIPNSVTNIGKNAFSGCSGLTDINIPNSVMDIGDDAFWECRNLTSATISNKITSIAKGVFFGCNNLTSVNIPNSVKTIGEMAFKGCHKLTSITIPNSVTKIGDYAFECTGLTSIVVESGNTKYDSRNNCNALIETSTNKLIRGCSNTIIPNDVVSISGWAFYGCSNLTSITIPNSVTSIDGNAFKDCGLTEVKVMATNPPKAYVETFNNYNIPLYVPEASISSYQSATPWKKFASINAITDNGSETGKCATPTIHYSNGQIIFSCATDGVTYVSSIENTDIRDYNTSPIQIGATYTIKVHATKSGYQDSDEATAILSWNGISPVMTGETTKYRLTYVVDNRVLSTRDIAYGSSITPPTTDNEGNTVLWYTYPATMPAHDLVVYGMVMRQPEPEVLVWLTVKDGQGTTKMKVRKGTEQVLTITPEEGWKVVCVTLDGVDVTAQVKDGSSYTTPAITNDATLIVVYEQDAPSDVASARAGQATVKVVDDGVVITHAEPQSRCVVYTSNGQQVVSTVIEGDNQKIRLQKGQVYILTINGRTLKFAL